VRILFASQAMDGHFNPMTGLAKRLQERGHDVRWYTGPVYAAKLEKLGIPLVPYKRAVEHRADNLAELYPERARLKGPILMGFDGEKVFASNVSNFFEDIRELHGSFPFDVVVADTSMFIHRLVSHLLDVPVVNFVVVGNLESDPLVPPPFFGFRPARHLADKALQKAAGFLLDHVILRAAGRSYRRQHAAYGQPVPGGGRLIDETYRCAAATIQTGPESFDFPRRRINPTVHYVGALLPYRAQGREHDGLELPGGYSATVVVTQGTIDNADHTKLIIPALEALKDTDTLVVVATGGRGTDVLNARYPQPNVVVRDYVDFAGVFDITDVYITNGGYGGVQLSLSKGVPLVVAGLNEGKNDVNARVEYAGVGVNLRSERPKATAIAKAVEEVLTNPRWKRQAEKIQAELAAGDATDRAAAVVERAARTARP
jgi:MGT family glycosyltransferase